MSGSARFPVLRGTRTVLFLVLLSGAGATAAGATTAGEHGGCGDTVTTRTLQAEPGTLDAAVAMLEAGDLLQLAAGDYTVDLWLEGLHGSENDCIVIEGPAAGPRPGSSPATAATPSRSATPATS